MALLPLLDKELVIVTGKGGVGKTSVSLALADLAARSGRETLLIEMVASPRAAPLMGQPPQGYDPVEIAPRLHLINLDAMSCLEEIVILRLKFRALHRLVFKNRTVSALMDFMPGMNELLVLGKIVYMVNTGRHRDGRHPFDLVILDAPPSGEGLSMLRMPGNIASAVKTGPLARDVGEMESLLTDPERTGVAVVTLPEELPVNEAVELVQQLREDGLMSGGEVITNRVLPPFLGSPCRKALDAFTSCVRAHRCHPGDQVAGALEAFRWLEERRSDQELEISRLQRSWRRPVLKLPELSQDRKGPESIARLSDHLRKELERTAAERLSRRATA